MEAGSREKRLQMANEFAGTIKSRAENLDREAKFPVDNIEELKQSKYTALTVPQEYGGLDISLYEMVRLQEQLAIGDGSTALSIGWHLGVMKNLGEKKSWEEGTFRKLCEDVMRGALINGAATERQTGSPTRGGMPQTTAVKEGQQWVINGRKSFTTMAPVLDYFIVSAHVDNSGRAANFLIPRAAEGVNIEETWDSVAMRGTGSHDLVLQNVHLQEENLVEWLTLGNRKASGWLLHIPACYLGIAQAAQDEAIRFAKTYSPNSLKGPIIDLPNVLSKIGEMELELMRSREFLYSVAKAWDERDKEERERMGPELGAVKMAVTNAAITIVDLAMRVAGAHSLALTNPLQRYYRDVRAGIHNPPMDDMTIQLLAQSAAARSDSKQW